jgi:hypothetical protein
MEKISIKGIAENSKAGAIVVTNDNQVFYIEGINNWNIEILRKQVQVDGYLLVEHHNESELVNEKGEYNQGYSGEIRKITKPVWRLVEKTDGKDSILEKLEKSLPDGWIMKIEKDTLTILCKEKAYLMYENKINAPINMETAQQKEERFKKYGQLINPQFIFVLDKKLSEIQLNQIKSANNQIETSIGKFYKKLKDIPVDRKEGSFDPRDGNEKKMVSDFEVKKKDLESKMVKLPDYQTEKYALYLNSETGLETEFISIFPEKFSQEMYKIKYEIFDKVLLKVKD